MRRGVDSVAAMSEGEEWESRTTTQLSGAEPEPETDRPATSRTGSEPTEAAASSSPAPVLGESFCQCARADEPSAGFGTAADCLCGEDDDDLDWVWDEPAKSSGAFLSCDDRKVSFYSDYSCGTAAVRGARELAEGQHFWEIKMTSPVYGTDMMVGIGTAKVNLEKFKYNFGSLLGHDEDSWGLSYTGLLQHKGEKVSFSPRFGQGSIIGLHLDTWHGTLTIYKNRRCVGVAATRLQNKKLYPMLCSTAAKSSMKVIRACYAPTSLQYLCCARFRRMLPSCPDVLSALELPAGLLALLRRQLGWVFSVARAEGDAGRPSGPAVLCARDWPAPLSEPPRPPTSLGGGDDDESSEPEDYRSKRCRWT
ncbi:SPRY domain-containing SOCS box protein 3-like [Hippocampus zosterae]|uniref:SPRY domain-containing SOCS box protein 3-like n=1 Tax=Hippocampus zosterae TaxID=109293 RepID=UPI00223DFB2F|nr:SPRY domain-containing SOCS box protein 3-like [Hippocampus zosterae]XP_051925429.1 SPRY domain-containing SOCS box protein 3-like [Hippocampus zosterae]